MLDLLFPFFVCGLICAMIFDFFRFLIYLFRSRAATLIFDIFAWIICALVNFCFFTSYNNGIYRTASFLAEFISFILYFYSAGIISKRIEIYFSSKVNCFFAFLLKKLQKFKKIFKNYLHNVYNILYNKNKFKRKLFLKNKCKRTAGKVEKEES